MNKNQDLASLPKDKKETVEAEKSRQAQHWQRRERWKTAAIVLLAMLLVLQLFTSGAYSALLPLDTLRSLLHLQGTTPQTQAGEFEAAATPVRYSLYFEGERYAIEYNAGQLQQMQQLTQDLLEEAVASVKSATPILNADYYDAFMQQGIWFGYLGRIPLHAVIGWSKPLEDETALSYRISSLLLVEEGDATMLYFLDVEQQQAYRSKTALRPQDLLKQLSDNAVGIINNAADFAFELEEPSGLYAETLLSTIAPEPTLYNSDNPLSIGASQELLEALGFENVSDYKGANGQVYKDGSEMLRVSSGGTIEYENEAEESRYGQVDSMQEAIAQTRELMQSVEQATGGITSLQLLDVEQLDEGNAWIIYFGYSLDGIQVYAGQSDYCARFTVEDGRIESFLLYPRTHNTAGSKSIVLPLRQAIAALEVINPQAEAALELIYREADFGTLQAGWETLRIRNLKHQ